MKQIQLFKPKLKVDEILTDLKDVMESGWIGLGPKTAEFEKKFAEYVGAKYAVGVNSCTAALHLSLKSIGIKDGDLVITTPMTFVSTNHVILYQRAIPLFCDIYPNTLSLDVHQIEKMITRLGDKISAIMVVHYSGAPAKNIYDLHMLASKHNIPVIEDAAHACGANYSTGVKIGSCPYEKSLTCFSFHAVKNLGIGDGGMITTNSEEKYKLLKQLRWMGIDRDTFVRTETAKNKGYNWMYDVKEIGYKYHMNDIAAVFGLKQLSILDKDNAKRFLLIDCYKEFLNEKKVKFLDVDETLSANHLCVIKVKADKRDKLTEHLNENGIFPGVHYLPNHLYPCYQAYKNKLQIAEDVWRQIISLPLHLDLNKLDVKIISEKINGFLK